MLRSCKQGTEADRDTVERAIAEMHSKSKVTVGDPADSIQVHFRGRRYQTPAFNQLMRNYGSVSEGLRQLIDDWAMAQGVGDPHSRLLELEKDLHSITNEMSTIHSRIEATRSDHAINTLSSLEGFSDRFPELDPAGVLDKAKSVVTGFKAAMRELHQPDQWFSDQITTYRETGSKYVDRIEGESA